MAVYRSLSRSVYEKQAWRGEGKKRSTLSPPYRKPGATCYDKLMRMALRGHGVEQQWRKGGEGEQAWRGAKRRK